MSVRLDPTNEITILAIFFVVNIKSKNWMTGLNTKSIDEFDLIYLFNYKFGFMKNKRGIGIYTILSLET